MHGHAAVTHVVTHTYSLRPAAAGMTVRWHMRLKSTIGTALGTEGRRRHITYISNEIGTALGTMG